MWPLVAAIGLLGLAVGSFLNVVIYRVPRSESVLFPSSHCPNCDNALKPWHNVPVLSWLVLRGRCAFCRKGISVRYPLVEAATAALYVVMTLHFGVTAQLPLYLLLSILAVCLSLIDIDVRRLPNAIVLPSYVVGAALVIVEGFVDDRWDPAVRSGLALCALWAAFFLIALAWPGGLGFGDVKLAGLLGLFLGNLSWSAVILGAFGAFLLGSIAGIALLLRRTADRKTAIPFGPFMLVAALLAVFVAAPIGHWYVATLGIA